MGLPACLRFTYLVYKHGLNCTSRHNILMASLYPFKNTLDTVKWQVIGCICTKFSTSV